MSRRLLLLIGIWFTLAPVVIRADDVRWDAWLHYGSHLTQIDSDGHALRQIDLPIPENQSLQPGIAFSPDGHWVAYLTHLSRDQSFLSVYDTLDRQVTMTLPVIGDYWITSQYAGSLMFRDSGAALAFGYGLYHLEPLGIEWHILILNPVTGDIIYHLEKEQPAMLTAMGTHAALTFLAPFLRQYVGNELTFTLELLDTEGNPKSFVWDTATGNVTADIIFPDLVGDRFAPTGEVVMPVGDVRFPGQMYAETDILVPNTIHVYDPLVHGRYPFYATPDARPIDLRFVQGGERILMQTIDQKWHLLERDGSELGTWNLPANLHPFNLLGTPDGFLYLTHWVVHTNLPEVLIPAVFEVNTRDDTLDLGRSVWSINTRQFQSYFDSSEGTSLEIAWVHSDVPMGPFLPWAQLAEPVYAPIPEPLDSTIAPTSLPPPEPIFQVGDEVRVQTIDGEILNLRVEPTRQSEIIVYIKDNTHLLLLEGPIDAEGYTWWRIRTPDGLEGWVVENDGEVQTLVPLK